MKATALKTFAIMALLIMSFSLMSFSSASARKFWGTETSYGAIGHNTDGTDGCFRGIYETYYVFWIATGEPQLVGQESVPCP
jgi:hypothetical protein